LTKAFRVKGLAGSGFGTKTACGDVCDTDINFTYLAFTVSVFLYNKE